MIKFIDNNFGSICGDVLLGVYYRYIGILVWLCFCSFNVMVLFLLVKLVIRNVILLVVKVFVMGLVCRVCNLLVW